MSSLAINVAIDEAKFSRFHLIVIILCAILLIVDGYDVFIFGVVLSQLMDEWKLTPPQAGWLASAGLAGMMFGALIFGSLGDRIGRKKCITICFLLFTIPTFLIGFATAPAQFGILRLMAGLGCGGLMPNAVALTNEFSPKRMRSTLVAFMFSGYAIGGILAASLGIWMLPAFGWRSMFFAATVPLLLLPFLMWKLPESVGFLIRRGEQEKARQILSRFVPLHAGAPGDLFHYVQSSAKRNSAVELFSAHRAAGTFSIWVCFFCCLLMVYALGSWLPQLMRNAGYSLGSALSFLVALNFGGAIGAITGGRLADKFGLPHVVMAYFILGALCIMLLGLNSPMPLLYLLIFVAGAGTTGTQILLYASAAEFYDLSLRSTGVGWASGVGRIGAIVGPMLGGLLLAAKLPMGWNFVAFAVPGVIAVFATAVFMSARERRIAHDSRLREA